MKKSRLLFISLLSAWLLTGCKGVQKLSNEDLSDIYRRNTRLIEPEYKVYHTSNLKTRIHFKINTETLVYVKDPNNEAYSGRIRMSYRVYENFDSKELIDSASTVIEDTGEEVVIKNLYGQFDLNVPGGREYILKVKAGDVNRDQTTTHIIKIDKKSTLSRQNFRIRDAETGNLYFQNYINGSHRLEIEYNHLEAADHIEIDYFSTSFPVAPPPFASYADPPPTIKPDSTFNLRLNSENKCVFRGKKPGIYHFRVKGDDQEGMTLFYFDDRFPVIKNTSEMISALRFITSKKEYEILLNSEDQKLALDSFWLNTAGNTARAKELIKAYYNRVQNANLFFTSYKEGWKTDRGIIYMIFGPPNMVYKSAEREAWVYGEANNHLSVNFIFDKGTSPFSDNHYTLRRSPNYKNPWYRAVESWRQGRVSALDY